ncbi:TPA: hypothetical protein ACJJBT_001607, partial [Neisseria meningitidis]
DQALFGRRNPFQIRATYRATLYMSSCVLKHLEFLSETGVFETENRMAERCRPGAKVRHDAAGVARACRGKENRERGRAETLPEEKAGLRGGKRGMRRAESACVGRKGVIIFCLLACLLACLLGVCLFRILGGAADTVYRAAFFRFG